MGKKINFGSGDGYLLNDLDKDIKHKVIDLLYNSLNLSNYRYIMLDNIQKLKSLQDNEHYVSPNYKGLNYYLIFMMIGTKPLCVLIDTKKLSYYKNKLDFRNVSIIKIFVNTTDNIFSNSIFYGKVIQKEDKYYFLIQDCFYLMNKKIIDMELNQKMLYLNDIIKTNFSDKNVCDNFNFKLNKLYKYSELPELIHNIIPKCGITNNGLVFIPKYSGITFLFVEKKLEKVDIDSKQNENIENKTYDIISNFTKFLEQRTYSYEKNNKTKHLWVKKTNIPDVYYLYENKDEPKIGIAHIPNIKISLYCLKEIGDEPVKFNCIYNNKFDKWIPLNKI
jgi:hypothetical protein